MINTLNSFIAKATLLDYITEKYILFLEEPKKILARGKNILKDIEGIENALVERERIIPNALENYISIEEFSNNINELKKDIFNFWWFGR